MWSPVALASRCLLVAALLAAPAAAEDEQPVIGDAKEALRQELLAANRETLQVHRGYRIEAHKQSEPVTVLHVDAWRDGDCAGLAVTSITAKDDRPAADAEAVTTFFTDGSVLVAIVPGRGPVTSSGAVALNQRLTPLREGRARLARQLGVSAEDSKPWYPAVSLGAYPEGDVIRGKWSLGVHSGAPDSLGKDLWAQSSVGLLPTAGIVVLRQEGLEAQLHVSDGAIVRWRASVPSVGKRVTIDERTPAITADTWPTFIRKACEPHHGRAPTVDVWPLAHGMERLATASLLARAPPAIRDSAAARAQAVRIVTDAEIAVIERADLVGEEGAERLGSARSDLERDVETFCLAKDWPAPAMDLLFGDLAKAWTESVTAARKAPPRDALGTPDR